MRDLQQIYEKCLSEVKLVDIPVGKIESIQWADIKNGWGRCLRCGVGDTLRYNIEISDKYSDESISIKELYATICHEILHTCPKCWKHGKIWVKNALKVDAEYHYGIALFKSKYDIVNSELPVIHKMICPNCGGGWEIRNHSDWLQIQSGNCYFCAWCRHEMEVVF